MTWDKHLHEFRHALNMATHSSTKVSPAFLNCGRHPDQPKSLRRDKENYVKIQKIDEQQWLDRLKKLHELRDLVFENLTEARDKQKDRYNQGRKNIKYFVGD